MSKDIRSFFTTVQKVPAKDVSQVKGKRPFNVIDSDEEDNDLIRPTVKKSKESTSAIKTPQKKSGVSPGDFFGQTTVRQKAQTLIKPKVDDIPNDKPNTKESHSKKRSKKKVSKENNLEVFFDDDFEATLSLLDEEQSDRSPDKKRENAPAGEKIDKCNAEKLNIRKTPVKKIESQTDKSSMKTPEANMAKTNDGSEQKRKTNAEAYQRFLSRSGPRNPGSKPIPEGAPDCLQGKTFVISGVLESLDRDETIDLIKKYGGRTTSSVSKKTSYIILGDEPGASKLSKAEKLGVQQLSEDGLLDLIRNSARKQSAKIKACDAVDLELKRCLDEKDKGKDSETPSKRINKEAAVTLKERNKTKVAEINARGQCSNSLSSSGIGSSLESTYSESSSSNNLVKSDLLQMTPACSLWVDKYKPKSTKNIIGQTGDKSNVKKLTKWLMNWHNHHSKPDKKRPARPAPWAQGDDGSYYKAALLSGPPGVGKTTTAHLVCDELGYDVIEFNASDTRSKRLLNEQVAELLASKSIRNFYSDSTSERKRHALVMDEVDGMAGNEDRGGVQELINLIKNSRIPIICMCNDRSHPKMRSLVNYCFDLRFHRPRIEQIKGAMMSICFKEGVQIPSDALVDIISSANQDVRQVLHNLSLWVIKDKCMTTEQAKIDAAKAKKSLKIGPWDVARLVFSASDQEKKSIKEKEELFFQDYSLGPLFVQDTYVHVKPHKAGNDKRKILECLARAADSLAYGDIVERAIRSRNSWSLLPVQAIFSSVLPGHEMSGHVKGQINFPVWLGKNSKRNKIDRLLQELHVHTRLSTSGSKMAMNLDYSYMLRDTIIRPLSSHGTEGVSASLEVLQTYQLLREDLDSLVELCQWPDRKDPFSLIDSKVKSAFTRAYNKECLATSYATTAVKKSKTADAATDAFGEMDDNEIDEEDDIEKDTIEADAMIKTKKMKNPTSKKSEEGKNKQKTSKKKKENDSNSTRSSKK